MFKKYISILLALTISLYSCAISVISAGAQKEEALTITCDSTDSIICNVGDTVKYTCYLNVYDATQGNIWQNDDSQGFLANVDALLSFDENYLRLSEIESKNSVWPIIGDFTRYYCKSGEGLYYNATTDGFEFNFNSNDCILITCSFEVLKKGATDLNTVFTTLGAQDENITHLVENKVKLLDFYTDGSIEKISGINISGIPSNVDIFANHTFKIDASTEDENGLPYDISWSSSNEDIAIVSDNGLITALNAGSCDIIARVNEVCSEKCTVTVSDDIKDTTIVLSETEFTYNGENHIPEFFVTYGTSTLSENTDYIVYTTDSLNAGTVNAVFSSIAKPSSKTTVNYVIHPKDINSCEINPIPDTIFNASEQKPDIVIKNNSYSLIKNTDYTLSYQNNINAGEALTTISGIGNYTGNATQPFTIKPRHISECTVTIPSNSIYNGGEQKPSITVIYNETTLTQEIDYTADYRENTNAGTAIAEVSGFGNFTGTEEYPFSIDALDINECSFSKVENAVYTGFAHTPSVTVSYKGKVLNIETDYDISYKNNINAGTASVEIIGKNNFKLKKCIDFSISPKDISSCNVNGINSFTFDKTAHTPSLTITEGSQTLIIDTDYTLSYKNNINAGTATVQITGKGNYANTINIPFIINSKNISLCSVNNPENQTYCGYELTPSVIVKDGSDTLVKNTDYTLSYINNINAGTASVRIEGKGNYGNSIDLPFTINKKPINTCSFSKLADLVYNGNEQKPPITVKDENTVLTENTDYIIIYHNNIDTNTASATITGINNYTNEEIIEFNIVAKDINECSFSNIENHKYNGKEKKPKPVVKDGEKTLTEGKDYELSYSNNTNSGSATVTITGTNNYTLKKTISFTIDPKNIKECTVSSITDLTYDSHEQSQNIIIKDKNKTLTENNDYTVEYNNNIDCGTASLIIKGINNYSDEYIFEFQILPKDINSCTFNSIPPQVYNCNDLTPGIIVKDSNKTLIENTDYTLSYSNNKNVGEAEVTITGINNYNKNKTIKFDILAKSIQECSFENIEDQKYSKTGSEPEITIKDGSKTLIKNTDYTVIYSDNTNTGEAHATVTGINNYKDKTDIAFSIKKKGMSELEIKVESVIYRSNEAVNTIDPAPNIHVFDEGTPLVENIDYTYDISIGKNQILKGTISFTGINNYTQTVIKEFDFILIGDADNDGTITISDASYIQMYMAKLIDESQINLIAAKTTDDEVSIVDATRIQQYLAKIIKNLS